MGSTRRVVVTGVGAVTPVGTGIAKAWEALLAGRSGIGPITRFDASTFASRIAGEVQGFDPEAWIERKRIKEMDRFIQLAMAAAKDAIDVAGFEPDEAIRNRTGTIWGVGMCGLSTLESMKEILDEKGPRKISPYFIPAVISNLAPGQVSIRWGLRGPSFAIASACASGAHAIGEAFRGIQRGGMDACVVGGAEAAVTELGVAGFCALRSLSTRNDEPEKASRPFDRDRDGFVISEGASALVLEEREMAMRRGALILCELIGYGASADAFHLTQPDPHGKGAMRAMQDALDDGRLRADQIDYVNAHGTSTPHGDAHEIEAVRQVFGDHLRDGLWVSSTKSMTGHLLGAAGALEAAICCLSIRDGAVPPTINLDRPDPAFEGIDLVPGEARARRVRYALSNSFGFGGTNVSLILGAHNG